MFAYVYVFVFLYTQIYKDRKLYGKYILWIKSCFFY